MRYIHRLWITLALASLAVLLLAPASAEDAAQARYDAAQALYEAEQYREAHEAFAALDGYADSEKRAGDSLNKEKAARYKQARALYKEQRYDEAKAIFDSLGKYKDSSSLAEECEWKGNRLRYIEAEKLFEAGNYQEALERFEALGSFRKSREYAQNARDQIEIMQQYQLGLELREAGDLTGARDAFIASGDYLDATGQLYGVLRLMALGKAYKAADTAWIRGELEQALESYENLGDYEDSEQKAALAREALKAATYEKAAAIQLDDPALSFILYTSVSDVQDSAGRAAQLLSTLSQEQVYACAARLEEEKAYALAQVGFGAVSDYQDGVKRAAHAQELYEKTRTYNRAVFLSDMGDQEEANALFKSLGNFLDSRTRLKNAVPRISAKHLRDDATTPKSDIFTAPDGSKHVYQMFKGVRTWREAKAFCEILGGHLATMTTAEENQFVYHFMRDSGHTTAYFGLIDPQKDGNWQWVTDEPFAFRFWHKGEPNGGKNDKYGMYFYKHKDGGWNDAHFEEVASGHPICSYICEWDLAE